MSSSSSPVINQPTLSQHAASVALTACQKKAHEIGIPMNIAIVSQSLHLLAFVRMDGAKLTSIAIAQNKAFTAAGHRLPTHSYTNDKVGPGGPMFGIHHSNEGRFCTIGGGLPIILTDGQGVEHCVGGVGCSTGTPDQDRQVAEAGVQAILQAVGQKGVNGLKAKL